MRREPGTDLRQKIIEVAHAAVREGGARDVTMRAIAERLGYSPASIYLHFRGKDELLREVARIGLEELIALFRAQVHEMPLEALRATTRAFMEYGVANPAMYRLMFQDLAPGAAGPDLDARQDLLDITRRGLELGIAQGAFREADPLVVTLTIWAQMHGFILLATAGRTPHDEPSPKRLLDAVATSIERSLAV